MELVKELFFALWSQDYITLSNQSLVWAIYFMLFSILFLENGVLPASFLPGDSLLILVGVLIEKGTLSYPITIIILTTGASLGCWISYIQGRWLGNTKLVKSWLSCLPDHYYQRAQSLFQRHGLSALLIGRFLAFIRTLLPIIAGLSGLTNSRFQLFNWLSGLIWVLILTAIGYGFSKSLIFQQYEHRIMNVLMLIPAGLIVISLVGSVVVVIKEKISHKKNH
ncbi:Inner membrane protein YqjA [Candidatus Hartigia pinicola]|nr:Inner membrane protein YqjA [Candidatus Hartigia pinicola]